MAAIENLEIIVEIDIAEAISKLERLQEELQDVAEEISAVDARGTEGIDINTTVDDLDAELARLQAEIEAFEAASSIDIDTDVDRSLLDLAGADLDFGGFGGGGPPFDDFLTGMAGADMDFGGFNVPRGRGISRGDGMVSLRRRLRRLRDKFRDLTESVRNFDLRMTDIHNALARLVPLLLLFIGVIPTAVAALTALATAAITAAGALAAIGGLGLMGAAAGRGEMPSGEDIQEELSEIRDMFFEAFAPLAEALAPVFEDAMDGLERFFEAIAAEGDALMGLVDEMRAFGGFVMEFFPGFLRTLSATLEALAPIFGQIGSFIQDNFQNIMRDLVRITLEAAPALGKLARQIGSLLMTLAEMGVGFAIVSTVVLDVLGLIGDLFRALGLTNEQIGLIIASILAFASAILLARTAVIKFAAGAIKSAIVSTYQFWVALLSANSALSYLAGTSIVQAVLGFKSFVASVLTGSVSLQTLTASALSATGAVAALMTVLTLGAAVAVAGVALSIASNFFTMADSIDQATSSLEDFNRVAGRTEGTDFNPYGGDDPAGTRGGASGTVSSGQSGGTTINYESSGDPNEDASNLDKTAWRANRTTGSA